MSTFRNAQLEEILNNERSMNRVILDRTSAHINALGDEKAPPTIKDLKLEATLGALIDGLKEKINKAIQLISSHQYGSLDEKRVERLLTLDSARQDAINEGIVQQADYKSRLPADLQGKEPDSKKKPGTDDNVVN